MAYLQLRLEVFSVQGMYLLNVYSIFKVREFLSSLTNWEKILRLNEKTFEKMKKIFSHLHLGIKIPLTSLIDARGTK